MSRTWLGAALTSLAAIVVATSPVSAETAPSVQTRSGVLVGEASLGVASFKGVPYAAAPVGRLRWAAPEAPPPWSPPRDATRFGPVCPQPIEPWANGETGEQSEDCLKLNVWTPALGRTGARLPVMVWLHGGGYTAGAGSQSTYDGRYLAARGVVVVTLNYRLGVLGFLAHPALSAESPLGTSGDYGLLDQIAALRWVRANISAFGGDSANVTLFGESAGGGSVLLLAESPLARQLFAKMIVESGAALEPPAGDRGAPTLAQAEAAGSAFADKLGARDLVALRAVPVSALVHGDAPAVSTHPIIDGRIVPTDPTLAFRAGEGAPVPVLIGWNSAEGSIFARGDDPQAYQASVRATAGAAAPALLRLYPPSGPGLVQRAMDEISDTTFAWRGWSIARAAAPHASVFVYNFDNPPPRPLDSAYRKSAGAGHSEELAFVWGAPAQQTWPEGSRRLSDAMQRYWVSFARTGDPNGPGLAPWPKFDRAYNGPVLHLKAGEIAPEPTPRLRELEQVDVSLQQATSP
jgi:para-nitrobenzyl esterase